MSPLLLHEFHAARGAVFMELNGCEAVSSYASFDAEYGALARHAALVDLSFRSRICILGADREKFLHGQVTNDVLRLKSGQGCYAAVVSAKGKIQSDLFIYKLRDELLLDFEPGLAERVSKRLEQYVIAEDVQLVDVSPHYGLLSVFGPESAQLLENAKLPIPDAPLGSTLSQTASGELYVMNNPRFAVTSFDLFVPVGDLEAVALALESAGKNTGVHWVGFAALETLRIENGIPRYGPDMTENTLPQEAELQDRAISFAKGCYIGQEVIARIRTYGQVAKALRLLRIESDVPMPAPGTKLFGDGKEVGFLTTAARSPKLGATAALGYIRKEINSVGTKLRVGNMEGPAAEIVRPA